MLGARDPMVNKEVRVSTLLKIAVKNLGHHNPAIETALQWEHNGGAPGPDLRGSDI